MGIAGAGSRRDWNIVKFKFKKSNLVFIWLDFNNSDIWHIIQPNKIKRKMSMRKKNKIQKKSNLKFEKIKLKASKTGTFPYLCSP